MSELHRQRILTGFAVVGRIDGENVFFPSGQLCRVVHPGAVDFHGMDAAQGTDQPFLAELTVIQFHKVHANLIYGRDVTPELKGRFDTVSISLNAPDEKEFLELTRSKFGIQSYEAIKEFAVLAKQYVPNVVMTVVEKVMPEEKIQKCREICDELGVTLRVRPFEN